MKQQMTQQKQTKSIHDFNDEQIDESYQSAKMNVKQNVNVQSFVMKNINLIIAIIVFLFCESIFGIIETIRLIF